MSSSESVAAPVPSGLFPAASMYQCIRPLSSSQSCEYFQSSSKSGWSSIITESTIP